MHHSLDITTISWSRGNVLANKQDLYDRNSGTYRKTRHNKTWLE